jgi:membrane protease YdiL (CAAX protease family)
MTEPEPALAPTGRDDVWLFFALACGLTWLLDLPFALSLARHVPPPPFALPLVGLGALGPTLAALMLARRRGVTREVFGRWRTNPVWILIGFAVIPAVHLPATLIEVALGGHPAHWFYPPTAPEQIAALVMFSVGEEFGWRGFAYPRMARRYGPVVGSLILGVIWALWHLGMMFSPEKGLPDPVALGFGIVTLALGSVVFAWAFERGNRSMAVAIALHMGAHLDNTERGPEGEWRLRVLRVVVMAVAAALAVSAG